MNRFWGHALSVAGLAVATGSSMPACAHDDASLFIQGVLTPPVPSGSVCTYTISSTAQLASNGIVDVAFGREQYTPWLLIGNTLVPQANATTPTSETARIEVQGAIVQVVDPATNATVENATVLASAEVDPASGSTPTFSYVTLAIMNQAAIDHFKPGTSRTVSRVALVYVTLYGRTLGGQDVQSNKFQFPVDVCTGCLAAAPAGAPAGYCQGATTTTASAGAACVLGQDQYGDCQICYPAFPADCNLTPP